MKLLITSLIALLVAVIIGSIAGSDTGYVMFSISGWTIQTSATLFVTILFLGFVLIYLIVRSIVRFIQMPQDIRIWRKHRHQRRAEKYLTEGLLHMTEGRWRQAERDFCKAAPYSRAPHVNYLCAARAAQESGAIDKRDDYLRLAYQNNPEASVAVGITQAELQLNQQQTEQALATLKHLQHKQPEQNQVRQLLLSTYTNLNDWQSVIKLLPSIKKTGLYTREQLESKQLEAYSGLLKDAGNLNNLDKLNKTWNDTPSKLKRHFYLIEVYVTERLRFEDTSDCEVLIRAALKQRWDHMLVRLYGLIISTDLNKQLTTAENWLTNHTRDPILLLTLGRICMNNHLWGKARNYLQESINIQPNPEAYYEYAKLHEHEGSPENAAVCYEKGLTLATGLSK
ncbi:MAG: heme biosynthesis protein HemY [Proteobacteria bacterium]|nr:heme biosynthesis protein HemY [Pseudomonadota bacterium]